jgi:urease accessory protein
MPGSVHIDRLPDAPCEPPVRWVDLPMTADERRRVRRRLRIAPGLELLLALPTGAVLPVGQLLHVEGGIGYRVAASPEPVVAVRPETTTEAARLGHLIGNLHRDIDLADDLVIALWDAGLEARLRSAGFTVAVERRPFHGRPPGEHAHA